MSNKQMAQDIRTVPFGGVDHLAQKIADHLTKLGYRKPQRVTTVEELDALPFESVVKASDGNIWESLYGGWFETASRAPHMAFDITLPATVLHVGTPRPARTSPPTTIRTHHEPALPDCL